MVIEKKQARKFKDLVAWQKAREGIIGGLRMAVQKQRGKVYPDRSRLSVVESQSSALKPQS